jgi:hypothetical protein
MRTITILVGGVSALIIALSITAYAQQPRPQGIQPMEGDTLQMTCAQARSMVHGKHGVLLSSGPNQFARYHNRDETCEQHDQNMEPALVRTKDNPLCFIGYTCEAQGVE